MAFYEGHGYCSLKNTESGKVTEFSNKFELDGMEFMEPNVHFFSFNNPYGACPECEGYGKVIGIDEDLVVPNKNLSVFEDAVASWKGESMSEWKKTLLKKRKIFRFINPITNSQKTRKTISGKATVPETSHQSTVFSKCWKKICTKSSIRVTLSRFRGKTLCPTCEGLRLREETKWVKIDGHDIQSMIEIAIGWTFTA